MADEHFNDVSQDDVPVSVVERLVMYDEAKAIGNRAAPTSSPEAADSEDLACVDLLHRVWPDLAPPAAPDENGPPKMLGDFRLVRELGRGGMGTVFEAEQISMGRHVALKVLPFAAMVQENSLQRFRNEVRAAAALDHPHIVSVYSIGEERGVHFYAMQLIRGQTLADLIGEFRRERQSSCREPSGNGPARLAGPTGSGDTQALISTAVDSRRGAESYRAAARLGIQAAEALQHAHDQGVLHRDVKPSNLMLDREGKLYVTDFGLARIEADAGMTMSGDILGTLRYMAPEQALAKRVVIDHRADIYSLGATLYELLTLQPAFGETDRSELLKQIAFEEPRPLRLLDSHIPAELETIVLTAMAKQPEERYQTAQLLADDLRAFLEHRPIQARPASFGDRMRKWSRRHETLVRIVGLASLLIIMILAAGIVILQRAQTQVVAALEDTSSLLYLSDMALAYQAFEKGWSDEAQSILDRHRPATRERDRRGLEWHLLQKRVQQPASISLAGHAGSVNELAVFPDRRRLASVGEDGTLRIWDAISRKLLRTIIISDQPLHSIAISPNGRYVAAGNTVVYLCDLQEADRISELFHSEFTVESLAFSPEGTHLAAGTRYEDVCLLSLDGEVEKRIPCPSQVESLEYVSGGSLLLVPSRRPLPDDRQLGIVELWHEGLSKIEQQLDGSKVDRPGRITVARSSPCGKFVAAGERYNSRVYLFELDSGRVLTETPVSRDRLSDLAYSPDGKSIAIGYRNGRVEYFELEQDADGKPTINRRPLVVSAHQGEVMSVRYLDANRLATCGTDGLVRIWDLPTDLAKVFDLTKSQMVSLGLSSDGFRLLYVCLHEFLTTDTNRGEIVFRHSDSTANFCTSACSPTGNRAAVGCSNSGSVTVFDWSGQTECSINHGSRPDGIAFSPDGSLVAIVGAQNLQVCRSDDGQEIFEQSLSHPGSSVGFSHTGAQLAYGERFGPVVVVAVATWQPLRELECGSDTHCLAFSPDDSLLATGHGDSIIRIWDVQTGRSRAELMGHECAVHDVLFSPDGHTLLSSADDGAVRLWSVDHGRGYGVIHQRFEPGSNEAKCRLSLSSDGGRLAIGYRTQQQGYPDVLIWKTGLRAQRPRMDDQRTD